MKTFALSALSLALLAGTAFADIHETQTFAGPYGTYANANAANTTLSATFTGVDAGTPYVPNGISITADLASVNAATYASEVAFLVTPPSGPAFVVYVSDVGTYGTLTDATVSLPLPAGVGAIGAWSVTMYETYYDSAATGTADSDVSNVRISLQDLPPAEPPASTDLGTLGSTDITSTDDAYNGVDVKWFKITLPANAEEASGYYVDITTDGSILAPGESETANDTTLALYDSAGLFYAYSDDYDYPTDPWSSLSLGAGTSVPRTHSGYADGFDGDMIAGSYYVATGAYFIAFGDTNFEAVSESISAGGSITLNVFSNFPGGPTVCSAADLGVQGGAQGQDNRLDNNDFIVFIDYFFNHNALADFGMQGGVPGQDGLFDNNDFIVFIDTFFNDQASCTG